MYEFFQSQLDFIYFFYGLAFIFLGVICFLIKRQFSTNIKWQWLSAFGILHGINEWCDMASLVTSSNIYWFQISRLFILIISFVCLLEFARQNWNQYNKINIGWWLYVFVVPVLFGGWFIYGRGGLEIFSRFILGISGAFASGLVFWKLSSLFLEHRKSFFVSATACWLYALSQLFVSSGQLFGIKYTNQAVFFEFFNFPIQLVRGFLALVISVSIWVYYQKLISNEVEIQKSNFKSKMNRRLAYLLIGVLIIGWFVSESLGKYAWQQEFIENKNIIEALDGSLERILVEGKDLSQVLSSSPGIVNLLKNYSPQSVAEANLVLDRYKLATNVSITYVLDKTGTTLATSNRNAPDSLLGKNYAFRPYFSGAINGSPSILFAVGVTTREPGFYASYPVKDERGVIMGVVVVKMGLTTTQENFRRYGTAFLVSPEGIIFLSGLPKYHLNSVEPLSGIQKRKIYSSQQFSKGSFENIFDVKPLNNGSVEFEGGTYFVMSEPINGEGWSLIFLHNKKVIGFYRLFGLALTFIFYIIIISFVTMEQDVFRNATSAYLASIISFSDDAIVGKNLEGRIISWNKGAEKIYGYSKEEMIGQMASILIPDDKVYENDEILKQVGAGKSIEHYETTHIKKSGQVIFVSLTISPILNSSGQVIGASMVSRDITKEKISEEMVRHSEKKFNSLFNSISDPVFISDLDGNFLVFNQTMVNVFGYTKKELYKMRLYEINTPEFAVLIPERLKMIKKTGEKKFEAAFITKSGVVIPVEMRSNLIEYEGKEAILNSARDITERKLAELSIKEQMTELQKFKLAVDASSDSIIIADQKARVLYANEALSQMTGFDRDEVIGQYIGHLWGGHMEKSFYENMWRIIKDEKKVFSGELNNRRKNGEEYIVGVKFYPLLSKDNQVEFFVGIETDITKIKQLERVKSEFVSVASHQLRTPLTGIKWFTELLLKGKAGKLTTEQEDYVQQIFHSNDRMVKLVDDLLDVSHMDENGKFKISLQEEKLPDVIKELVSQQEISAQSKKIKIKVGSGCQKNINFKVDKSKIIQAFGNILNNAIKYSPSNSTVIVDCKKEKDSLVYMVKDQGIGIPFQQQSRVFQKFFRADNVISTGSGTGLGLYISKYIIYSHAGKIWFESKENKGTTFYVSLPIK